MLKVVPAKKQGHFLEIDGRALSSKVDPINASRRWLLNLQEQHKYLVSFGLAPVYHLAQMAEFVDKILILDPRLKKENQLLDILASYTDLEELNKADFLAKAKLFIQDDVAFYECLRQFKTDEIVLVDCMPNEYEECKIRVKKEIKNLFQSHNTADYFEGHWAKNTDKNLLEVKRWISEIKIDTRKKAVLIGSGPSLEFSWKEIVGDEVVFSVPGAVPFLKNKNKHVDYVVSTDASFYNTYHLQKLYVEEFNLIVPLSIHPSVPLHWQGDVFFFYDLATPLPEGMDVTHSSLPMEGTVASTMIRLIYLLGFKEVKTFGLDFSLYPFKAHINGNETEEILFMQGDRLNPTETRMHYLYHFFNREVDWGCGWSDDKLELYRDLALAHFPIKKKG